MRVNKTTGFLYQLARLLGYRQVLPTDRGKKIAKEQRGGPRERPPKSKEKAQGAWQNVLGWERSYVAMKQLSDLVADLCLCEAEKLTRNFEALLSEERGKPIAQSEHKTILTGFALFAWELAIGIWSNLKNTNLRRDLLAESKHSLALALARKLSGPDADVRDVATLAVRLSFDEIPPFHIGFVKQLRDGEVSPDANGAFIYSLEWIQKRVRIPDWQMNIIVPGIETDDVELRRIEETAHQVNAAALQRKRKWWPF